MTSVSPAEDGMKSSTRMNKEQAAQAVKDLARRIREQSTKVKDTVQFMHESGAIEELSLAIRDAAVAARDATREINSTTKELKERGVFRDAAAAVDETTRTTRETLDNLNAISKDVREAAPDTAAELGKAAGSVREGARATAQKAREKMKKGRTAEATT